MHNAEKINQFKNLHIIPDNKFIDAFIADIKEASCGEVNCFLAFNRYDDRREGFTYITSPDVIYSPPSSSGFYGNAGDLKKYKRIFIHWLLPNLEEFVRSIPPGPLVCWCFWGEFDASFGPLSKLLRFEKKSRDYADVSNAIWNLTRTQALRFPFVPFFLRQKLGFFTSLIRWVRRVIAISRVDVLLHWNEADRRILSCANLHPFLSRHEFFYNVIDVALSVESKVVDKLWLDHHLEGKNVLLVGHSSFPSGNHLDALDLIKNKLDDDSLRVIAVLSYGDPVYREVVIQKGVGLFGSRFISLTEFLPIGEYYYLLSRISAAFLNHRYSEGAGNIFRVLMEGKPLFLNRHSTIYKMLKEDGVSVYCAADELSIENIKNFSTDLIDGNIKYISERFSSDASVRNLRNFLKATG